MSAASLAIIALVTLAACEQKPAEAPAKKAEAPDAAKKVEAPDAAKKAAEAPAPAAPQAPAAAMAASAAAPQPNPDRNAYFGEEHIHTGWSVDAWVMRAKYTVLLPAPPDAPTAARVAATPRRKEIPTSSGEGLQ